MLIGLISDTHGLLRPAALDALRGVELILHAGDVGGRMILAGLRRVAPVHAAYGNVDDPQDPDLERAIDIELNGVSIHVSHGHELGSPTPDRLLARYSASVIVYGHTHRALVQRAAGRLVVNPGAAGPARFNLKPGVAILTIQHGHADVELVTLK